MNRWPEDALTREEVADLLLEPMPWRIDWCAGSSTGPTEGYGVILPNGVWERIPTRAKRRKFERGIDDHKTWIFAFVSERDGGPTLWLREGP